MTRLRRLQLEAASAARARGHTLGRFRRDRYGSIAGCEVCGRRVFVTTRPAPNEIDVGGEAVAVDCHPSSRQGSSSTSCAEAVEGDGLAPERYIPEVTA